MHDLNRSHLIFVDETMELLAEEDPLKRAGLLIDIAKRVVGEKESLFVTPNDVVIVSFRIIMDWIHPLLIGRSKHTSHTHSHTHTLSLSLSLSLSGQFSTELGLCGNPI